MALALWFAGLIGLIVAAAVTSGRGRANPSEVIGRGVAAIAAVAYAGLIVSAIWLWGGQDATDGRADRLREGATVSVTIEGTRIPLAGTRAWTIGHGAQSQRGRSTIRLPGDGAAVIAKIEIEKTASIATTTEAVRLLSIRPEALGGVVPHACREPGTAAFELPAQARVLVLECDGAREVAAWTVHRDPTHLIVTPLSISRGRLAPEQRSLHAGDALRIGSSADALPNLITWDVPAPGAAASMLAIPLDPTDCTAWATAGGSAREERQGCAIEVGAFSLAAVTFVPDAQGVLARNAWVAGLIGVPALLALIAFAFSPRRGRNTRAFGRVLRLCVLGGGLVALGCWRLLWAHRIDMADPGTRVDANLVSVMAIGAALAGNAVLAADALDGRSWIRRAGFALLGWAAWLAASVLVTGHQPPITIVVVGVLGLSAIAALAPVLGELAGRLRAPPEIGLLGVAAAALIAKSVGLRGALIKLGLAYATVLLGHAALRTLLRSRPAKPKAKAEHASVEAIEAPTVGASTDEARVEASSVEASSVEVSTVESELSEPREQGTGPNFEGESRNQGTGPGASGSDPLVPAPAAWRVAFRRLVRAAGPASQGLARRALLLGSLGAAVGALAMLDAGVTLAIAGVGLALAMLVAGHDAMYDASHVGRLGLLEREHARLLSAHGLATAGLAIGVGTCAVLASDRSLLEGGAVAMLHAPLVAGGLFALAALIARTHRRSWAPWLAAALAALAVWGMREAILERAMAGDGVASRRVAAVVEPGYALLRDDHAFVANASAWREASASTASAWRGQGYFGAAIRDPGVSRSIDNDYLAVLVARETGVAGLLQGVLLLLALVVGAGAIANLRLPHASREQRARWLVTGVAGVLVVYQPLAALGIVPLTGLTWPGLGIDSPGELWLFVIGAVWCLQGAEPVLGTHALRTDERVRKTPRLARARRIVLVALIACGVASVALVVRAGVCALSRANDDDDRVTAALAYASTLACATPDAEVATIDDALPVVIAGKPTDGATARYERELLGTWRDQRSALVRAFATANRGHETSSDAPASGDDPWLDAPHPDEELEDDASEPDAKPGTVRRARPGSSSTPDPQKRRATDAKPRGRDDATNARTGTEPITDAAGNNRATDSQPVAIGSNPTDVGGDLQARPDPKGTTRRKPATKLDARTETKTTKDRGNQGSAKSDARTDLKSGPARGKAGSKADAGPDKAQTDTKARGTGKADAGADVVGRVVKLFGLETQRGLACPTHAGAWRVERDGDACAATLSIGWPDVKVTIRQTDAGVHAACAIALPDDAVSLLRTKTRVQRPRIRVVSVPIGASADDLGELVLGGKLVRLRVGAPRVELTTVEPGVTTAGEVAIGDVTLAVRTSPRGVVLRGEADLFVAEPERGAAWRRWEHGSEVVLDRVTLIAAGPPARRVVAQFRPPRAWAGGPAMVDSLLADSAGDRVHRIYPHGAAVPELGWVNPYDVARSLGLDGWVHAYAAERGHGAPSCGTLAPPAISTEQVCSTSPLDGVLECRVSVQPQLVRSLRSVAERILADPKPVTGRDVVPVRVAFVALRGDTGEILAQGNLAAGRPPLAYAPIDARAEAELMRLRDEPGEAHAEKVEWNLPIAVGSTFKPIVARAAEQAFPKELAALSLTAAGHAEGCRKRRGISIDPIAGHCPPTSVAGQPTTADVHEFLTRSPNWFQAALGLVGLGLPDAKLMVKDREVTFAEVVGSDLATWPADSALSISDAQGPILGKRGVEIAGLRRAPMWTRVEALLGRPLCTLGDRASCERAAARADVCVARALPIASPGADLRNLVALGPDRIDPYPGNKPRQTSIAVPEYLQLLRGSGVHAVGSLAQITDAFGRVIYDPTPGAPKLAASWFPAPVTGTVPAWSCGTATGRENTVFGADGGLCGVVRPNGTAYAGVKELLADPKLVIYGAKTGTIDSLADIARNPRACARWNASHVAAAKLECGRAPPDDSLLVIAFGVVTPKGTIPITLGIQLQRAGKSAATKAAPVFVQTIARYLR